MDDRDAGADQRSGMGFEQLSSGIVANYRRDHRQPRSRDRRRPDVTTYKVTGAPPLTEGDAAAFRLLMDGGWGRWLPAYGPLILLAFGDNDDEAAVEDYVRDRPAVDLWETADRLDLEEVRLLRESRSRAERMALAAGVPTPKTSHDVPRFGEALGLLVRDGRGRLVLADPFPTVCDVGVLTVAECDEEQRIQEADRYERLSYPIVGRFVEGELSVMRTTIRQLAADFDMNRDDARGSLNQMTANGDFSVVPEPSATEDDEPLELRVDWHRFNQNRIGVASNE